MIKLKLIDTLHSESYIQQKGTWKIRASQNLTKLCKHLDLVVDIKKQQRRVEWVEHLLRMDGKMEVKKTLDVESEGRRKRVISRVRWIEQAKDDLTLMNIKAAAEGVGYNQSGQLY